MDLEVSNIDFDNLVNSDSLVILEDLQNWTSLENLRTSTPPNSIDSQFSTPPHSPPKTPPSKDSPSFVTMSGKHANHQDPVTVPDVKDELPKDDDSLPDESYPFNELPAQVTVDWYDQTVSSIFFEFGHVLSKDTPEVSSISKEALSCLGHADAITVLGITYLHMNRAEIMAYKHLYSKIVTRIYQDRNAGQPFFP